MWKIQTPPLVKFSYIWNEDYFDFGFDPPPPYGLLSQFVTFHVWKAPLTFSCYYDQIMFIESSWSNPVDQIHIVKLCWLDQVD